MTKLLCLSNGHGEDAIAIRILRQLQQLPDPPELAALPLVGQGDAFRNCDIPIIGPVKPMPSGGFVYMDGRQLWRDLRGGLLQLTLSQVQAVKGYVKQGGVVLAVGDIVPLLFAWLSGANYAFVGTAKSEYYLRDEGGMLPRRRQEGWSGSVYLPWERWLMSRRRCKAVFPRDSLTTEFLQQWSIPAFDVGNPMMDDLEPTRGTARFYGADLEAKEQMRSLDILLLPGSRAPEAYDNWQQILMGVSAIIQELPQYKLKIDDPTLLFLGAIAPSLNLETFGQILESHGWRPQAGLEGLPSWADTEKTIGFTQRNARLLLTQSAYNDCLHQAEFAIAMAGTATEQFVGLGKPAIVIPGKGPQLTPAFAEAQSRLLGPSVILVQQPYQVASEIHQLLQDPDRLQLISQNGKRRMGKPGASQRLVACLQDRLL
ncbi:MAG: lipid-A-disaccharide synthase-related protein [Desertifilum sp.]|nr:lipid-A-disaccharide synthase-related protein [Desertifilum sp.]